MIRMQGAHYRFFAGSSAALSALFAAAVAASAES